MPSTSEMMPIVLLPPALLGCMLLSMLGCICSIIEYRLKSPVLIWHALCIKVQTAKHACFHFKKRAHILSIKV